MAQVDMPKSSIGQKPEQPKKKFEKVVKGKVIVKEQNDIQKIANDCHWITIEDCRTLEDVIWHFNNGDCTLYEARAWCLVNNAPQYEFLRRISEPRPEFTGAYNTRPQEKEPWPYRLVAFLDRCLEILINSILEDFV